MAQSVTITTRYRAADSDVVRITIDWTSHTDGTVTQAFPKAYSGIIERVVFNPGATAPTDLYDVTITDDQGVDVLAGQGANLSTSATSHVKPGIPFKDGTTTSVAPVVIDDTLTLNITNAGSGKVGAIVVYLRVFGDLGPQAL